MTDNVISMTEHAAKHRTRTGARRPAEVSSPDQAAAEHTRAERAHRISEESRLAVMRDLYRKTRLKWPNTLDRLRAAQVLGHLLSRKGTRHVTNADLRRAWREENNGSEFQVYRLRLPADVDLRDPSQVRKYEQKITNRLVQPYARRARFIAALKGLPEDDSEAQLFRHTSLWRTDPQRKQAGDKQPLTEALTNLTALLQETASRVARQANLAELMQRMRKVGGQWNIDRLCFEESSMAALFRTAYQDEYEAWEEAPPLPSVPLVRLWHAGLKLPIRLSKSLSAEPLEKEDRSAPVVPADGIDMKAELHIYRDIGLAVGPTVNATTIGALFETRPHVELRILKENGSTLWAGPVDAQTNWNLGLLDPGQSAGAFLDGRWRRFSPLVPLETEAASMAAVDRALAGKPARSPFLWEFTPEASEVREFEIHYMSWTAVDHAYVERWLVAPDFGQATVVNLPPAPSPRTAKRRSTWYPRPILAHHVETAIYDGSLEAALVARVGVIRDAFNRYEAEWLERMRRQTDEVVSELRDDLPPSAQPDDPAPAG